MTLALPPGSAPQSPAIEDEAKRAAQAMPVLKLDRRSLLFAGALSVGFASPAFARVARARPAPIQYVVTDLRYRESLEFGRLLTLQGAARLEVADGLTGLWQNHLAPFWQGRQGLVAGLTTREVWDCLAEQARGQFRKPRRIGHHAMGSNAETASHILTAPQGVLHTTIPKDAGGASWPAVMARLASRCAIPSAPGADVRLACTSLDDDQATHSLISWIIA